MKIVKIMSGGQTGADMGGLLAAKQLGLITGGYAPYQFMTEEGPNLALRDEFGLVEGPNMGSAKKNYHIRTELNVANSDATVIFGDISSPGSLLTVTLARDKHEKPVCLNPIVPELVRFFRAHPDITILNVAGNRESKNPGIQKATAGILVWCINLLKEQYGIQA